MKHKDRILSGGDTGLQEAGAAGKEAPQAAGTGGLQGFVSGFEFGPLSRKLNTCGFNFPFFLAFFFLPPPSL